MLIAPLLLTASLVSICARFSRTGAANFHAMTPADPKIVTPRAATVVAFMNFLLGAPESCVQKGQAYGTGEDGARRARRPRARRCYRGNLQSVHEARSARIDLRP